MLHRVHKNRKGNIGVSLFLGVILFQIILYCMVYAANADPSIDSIGDGSAVASTINASSTDNLSTVNVRHWYSGFDVRVFDMPWYINIFYVTFLAVILGVSIYALIRGLS